MGRQASGFICPKCKSDTLQNIVGKDVVHILELQCAKCDYQWAVEASASGGFMSTTGKVVPE